MPGEKEGISPKAQEKFAGISMPYGFTVALLAIKSGVKKVAVVSLGGHHDHPILWFCDDLEGEIIQGFYVDVIRVGMRDDPYTKDWGRALKALIAEKSFHSI